jgi:hypothetical protein
MVGAASSRSCRAARRPTVMRPGIAGASAAGLAILGCGAENDADGLSIPGRPAHRSPASKHVAGLFWTLRRRRRRRRLSGVVLSGPREEYKRRRNPVFYVPRRFRLRDRFRKSQTFCIMGAFMKPHVHFFVQLTKRNMTRPSKMQKREFRMIDLVDTYYHRCARSSKCSTLYWPRRANLSKSRYSYTSVSKSRTHI